MHRRVPSHFRERCFRPNRVKQTVRSWRGLLNPADESLRQAQGRAFRIINLARLLLHVWRRFGRRLTPLGPALAPPLSQADLAAWIGASPSAVARTLANWRTQHVIETGHSLIRILDPKVLSALASYPPWEGQAEPPWRASIPPVVLTERDALSGDSGLVLPVDLYYLRRTSPGSPTSPDSNWAWWQRRRLRVERRM